MVPALAVADALRAEGAQVSFIGGNRAEAQLVPEAGYELRRLRVEGLSRSNPVRAARAAALAALAVPRARKLLSELDADAVMGGGGYVAGPVGLAALAARRPLVLTEADSHLGLTNRLLAPRARRVCLAFPLAGREGARYRVTGRPIPPPSAERAAARERFGLAEGEACLLVFGGSLGSRTINLATIEAFAAAPFRVIHVCGRRDYPALAAHDLRPGYQLLSYLELADFGLALAAADLAVARAGGSVFELAAYGLPSILIPFPHAAGDHQSSNARWMAQAGAAVVIEDAELSAARLGVEVATLLADAHGLRTMSTAALGLARPTRGRGGGGGAAGGSGMSAAARTVGGTAHPPDRGGGLGDERLRAGGARARRERDGLRRGGERVRAAPRGRRDPDGGDRAPRGEPARGRGGGLPLDRDPARRTWSVRRRASGGSRIGRARSCSARSRRCDGRSLWRGPTARPRPLR